MSMNPNGDFLGNDPSTDERAHDLTDELATTNQNVSKRLAILLQSGVVSRRKDGTKVSGVVTTTRGVTVTVTVTQPAHTGTEAVSGMGRNCRICVLAILAVTVLALFPATAPAPGSGVGANLASMLKSYASALYGGIAAIVSLAFLASRRYTELAVLLFAACVVAWMAFAPSELATAAEAFVLVLTKAGSRCAQQEITKPPF